MFFRIMNKTIAQTVKKKQVSARSPISLHMADASLILLKIILRILTNNNSTKSVPQFSVKIKQLKGFEMSAALFKTSHGPIKRRQ